MLYPLHAQVELNKIIEDSTRGYYSCVEYCIGSRIATQNWDFSERNDYLLVLDGHGLENALTL